MAPATKIEDLTDRRKADTDAPESPIVPIGEVKTSEPGEPKAVKIKPGETAAQHEAHVLLGSDAAIEERLAEEAKGLPTDVIARRQAEEGIAVEEKARQNTTNPPLLGGEITADEPTTATPPATKENTEKASTTPPAASASKSGTASSGKSSAKSSASKSK
jgi:hypothetical protein